jgi:hypothetical protein
MEILELLDYVNEKLKSGLSTAKVEKELGFGKDTLRKKLNREGYSYNKSLKQYVTQVTKSNNIKCYRNNEDTYNPVDNNTGGTKMTLNEFKKLTTKEQIEYVNKFADGEKTLKEIEKENFEFTNIGKYIDRAKGYWDGDIKKYVYIEPKKQEIFTPEEIIFIKNLYKQHTITQNVTQRENEPEELITRSIRIDKDTIDTFAKYCKDNNIKQSTALKIALQNFMQN